MEPRLVVVGQAVCQSSENVPGGTLPLRSAVAGRGLRASGQRKVPGAPSPRQPLREIEAELFVKCLGEVAAGPLVRTTAVDLPHRAKRVFVSAEPDVQPMLFDAAAGLEVATARALAAQSPALLVD